MLGKAHVTGKVRYGDDFLVADPRWLRKSVRPSVVYVRCLSRKGKHGHGATVAASFFLSSSDVVV